MLEGTPSVLSLPEGKKQEILRGVKAAIYNLDETIKALKCSEHFENENYEEFLEVIDQASFLFRYYVPLIVGRTQQRLLKRWPRSWQVSAECLSIADETGAPVNEIYETFMSMMDDYIMP